MKKRRGLKINFHLSNRLSYTLIAIFILVAVGVGVYALTPGIAPNPGHLISETAPPSPCLANQFLQFDGTNWKCATGGGGTGHSGTPTLKDCGANTVSGTDSAGKVRPMSSLNRCILLFANRFTNTPTCVITSTSQNVNAYILYFNTNSTQLEVAFNPSAMAGFNYMCVEG